MKSQFFNTLKTEHLEGKWHKLIEGLGFYSERYDITVYAPPGFVTDFSSVPRLPFAYLLTGGTAKWEGTIHDMLYRWCLVERKKADYIYYDSGLVRNNGRENQNLFPRVGRNIRTWGMTGFVRVFGGIFYNALPGCLDYRKKDKCGRHCTSCDLYYPQWQNCIQQGFKPNIGDII